MQFLEAESNADQEPWTAVILVTKMWYSQHKENGLVIHMNYLEKLMRMCASLAYNI